MSATIIALLVGAFIAILCIVDATRWSKGRPLTLSRFFLMDGQLQLGGFALTISAANLSLGNFIVFISTWGYNYGLTGLLVFILNLALNVGGFILYLRVFRPYIEDRSNSGTIHEYIAQTYTRPGQEGLGRLVRLFASAVTVTGLTLAIIFELSLAVDLLQPASQLDRLYMFVGLAVLIAVFTAYGGFRSLFISDAWNGGLLLVGVVGLSVLIFSHSPSVHQLVGGATWAGVKAIGWPSILSICLIGSGWMLVAMDQWQRSCAARSYSISLKGTLIYFVVVATFATAFAAWGAFDAKVLPRLLPNVALSGATNPLLDITALRGIPGIDRFAIPLVVAGLVFAAVSTTNTFLNVASHSLTSDVVVGLIARRSLISVSSDANRLFVALARVTIVSMVSVLTVLYAIAVGKGLLVDPLSFFYIAYSVQFALLAPMAVSALPRKYRPGADAAAASIFLGFVTAIGVGFGSWFLMQVKVDSILRLSPGDWNTLTPVVTLLVGLIPLGVGCGVSYNRRASRAP